MPRQSAKPLKKAEAQQALRSPGFRHLYSGNPDPCHATRFKPGPDPRRDGTLFQKGNYKGAADRETWSKEFQERMGKRDLKESNTEYVAEVVKEAKDMQDKARSLADEALDAIRRVMKSDESSDQAVLQAANSILDRAYGKAAQTNINANVNADAKPTEISGPELDKRIAEALNRVEELTRRTSEASESEDRPTDIRKYN